MYYSKLYNNTESKLNGIPSYCFVVIMVKMYACCVVIAMDIFDEYCHPRRHHDGHHGHPVKL